MSGKSINDWARDAHELAMERGDWDREREELAIFAACHGHLARALDEADELKPMLYCETLKHNPCPDCRMISEDCSSLGYKTRPMGVAAECSRLILRLLDYLHVMDVDIEGTLAAVYGYEMREQQKVKFRVNAVRDEKK